MALPAPRPSIDTCNGCGKLFPRTAMRLCTACALDPEQRFELIREFLADNAGASVPAIAEATGVSLYDVRRFLEGGRLVEVDASGERVGCTCHMVEGRCPTCRNHLAARLRSLEGKMAADQDRVDGPGAGDQKPSRATYVRRVRRLGER